MKDRSKEIMMFVLGGLVVAGFFGLVVFKIIKGMDVQLETGALIASFTGVFQWFFGSSKGSNDKNIMLMEAKK